ncbi:hypothetical protein CVT25_008513 [Psilocybe cyanescens]|uniref:Uncharacterized protein n=1 Tax=Psilocybe cyanescens TaxID=93625 RepID=A0A409XNG6_PSICY|nr:hypothetical protein CVT25_008513 [Psilocybe cyanescens]
MSSSHHGYCFVANPTAAAASSLCTVSTQQAAASMAAAHRMFHGCPLVMHCTTQQAAAVEAAAHCQSLLHDTTHNEQLNGCFSTIT